MTPPRLDGKTVLLTGAAGGMGSVMTLALLEAGAAVVAVDRDEAALHALLGRARARGLEAKLLPHRADLGDRSACEAVVPGVLAEHGALHGLVNLAGIGPTVFSPDYAVKPVRFWECDIGAWQRLMDINVRAAWILAGAAVPAMLRQGWGRIVNVTTSFDTMLQPNNAAYGQSKAALEAATASWARELEGTGVTVNALAPGGPTDTPLIPANSPMPRHAMIRPEVMGAPAVWLLGEGSDGFTNRRVIARNWRGELPGAEAASAASAPAAWPGFGTQSVRPRPATT
ncbi:SDR family NAD(P)-dependent oxidoreductase [Roseomonas sp. BN140053]|uniref:SDR family NAD(P)-dependent oxidoreductase n=1 Tax=Roseomonas sp. BN140053 TaxID=3391898 RepID=UPI0039EC0637